MILQNFKRVNRAHNISYPLITSAIAFLASVGLWENGSCQIISYEKPYNQFHEYEWEETSSTKSNGKQVNMCWLLPYKDINICRDGQSSYSALHEVYTIVTTATSLNN